MFSCVSVFCFVFLLLKQSCGKAQRVVSVGRHSLRSFPELGVCGHAGMAVHTMILQSQHLEAEAEGLL